MPSKTRPRRAQTVEAAELNKPEVLGRGRYAIYQDPSGDGIISYRPEGAETDSHQVVPAKIWGLILGALRGEITEMNPMTVMKLMMGAK